MKNFIKKPYKIFWGIIPLILIIGYFYNEESFDLNIHDTYFVIYNDYLSYLISKWFVLIGLFYFTIIKIGRELKNWMNLIHSFITIFGLLILKILVDISQNEFFQTKSFYEKNDFDYYNYIKFGIVTLVLLIGIAQIIFIVNLIIALFSNKKIIKSSEKVH
tara:strand:+ start:58 stop:540 length:483 start_codon:yes stop_codon:yes gene_type:complete